MGLASHNDSVGDSHQQELPSYISLLMGRKHSLNTDLLMRRLLAILLQPSPTVMPSEKAIRFIFPTSFFGVTYLSVSVSHLSVFKIYTHLVPNPPT